MKKSTHYPALLTAIILILFSSMLTTGCKQSNETETNVISASAEPSREQYLDWFREAKFGMFIHWGPYSVLGAEWKGIRQEESNAEWVMKYRRIPVKEYRETARSFNPLKFNAKEYVLMAKATGMKYIVITAKHHDGFAMYHSAVTDYNIVDWTKFGRDPVKELADACAQEGLKFCVYYSHREDWDHPGGYGNDWDYENDWGDDLYHEKFLRYVEEKAKPQIKELLTNYGPIGLLWFDRGMYTEKQGKEIVKLVNDLQPACLINSRVGHYDQELLGDYQSMSDNGMPPGGLEEYWETPQTLNNTWGFSKSDKKWKTSATVIQRLVEIITRGGNYLLNIGPTGEGEVPQHTIAVFDTVGSWVKRNSESIYGTINDPLPEMTWGYTNMKGNTVYLFVRDWPKDGVLYLPGIKNAVKSAYLLMDKKDLSFRQIDNNIFIDIPQKKPDSPITVLAMNIDGTPLADPVVVGQDKSGNIELNYLAASTSGKAKTRFNRKGSFHISKWEGPEDSVSWVVEISEPGLYKINISYSAHKEWAGRPYEISIGNNSFKNSVIHTGDWFDYAEFPVGSFKVPEAGEYKLTIKPASSEKFYLMYLRSIKLIPVKDAKTEGWGVN